MEYQTTSLACGIPTERGKGDFWSVYGLRYTEYRFCEALTYNNTGGGVVYIEDEEQRGLL
jgi:hypothetical protein